jgi:carboxypeptidase Taq
MPESTKPNATPYERLVERGRELAMLASLEELLRWDQDVVMPRGGQPLRNQQSRFIAELVHERLTDPAFGDFLDACETDAELTGDPLSATAVNVREWRRAYDRAGRLPLSLVTEIGQTQASTRAAWRDARERDDFDALEPHLRRTVELCRAKARCLGWPDDGEMWDALAGDFDIGMTAAAVEGVFGPLREALRELIGSVTARGDRPPDHLEALQWPLSSQHALAHRLVAAVGFEPDRGRFDAITRAFSSGSFPGDSRITGRFDENRLFSGIGSSLHEAGHGMYTQGLDPDHFGTPMGRHVGLSIHESQSRLWENHVGRSLGFMRWLVPQLRRHFPDAGRLSPRHVCDSVNRVCPGPIRVDADPATYDLHIMIRFDLERALLEGDLDVADLPQAWNARYREDFDLEPASNAEGCLQDVHWPKGFIGYFPTYTMGNLYAAQFMDAAARELGDLDEMFAAGEFDPLLRWLNERVHRQGMRYLAAELCKAVTGEPVSHEPHVRRLRASAT